MDGIQNFELYVNLGEGYQGTRLPILNQMTFKAPPIMTQISKEKNQQKKCISIILTFFYLVVLLQLYRSKTKTIRHVCFFFHCKIVRGPCPPLDSLISQACSVQSNGSTCQASALPGNKTRGRGPSVSYQEAQCQRTGSSWLSSEPGLVLQAKSHFILGV